jgi:hypothetical protein
LELRSGQLSVRSSGTAAYALNDTQDTFAHVVTLGWAPKGPTQARRREADIHRLLLKGYDDDSVYDLE